MTGLAVKRLAQAVPVLLLVSVLSFLLLRAAPGNPAQLQAGLNASPAAVAAIARQLGLDKPLYIQYWIWLKGLFHGNLGVSYSTGEPVTSVLASRVPVTAELGLISIVVTIIAGIPLGVWAALRKDGPVDQATRVGALAFVAVPNFVLALFLVLLFGWWVRGVLPYQGYVAVSQSLGGNLSHMTLPAICLAAGPVGIVSRFTRTSMLEVLGAEYVTAARALGVPWLRIVWVDALRNALLPVLTILGLITGYVISGAVIVETIFGLPGLGALLVQSFSDRDYTVTIAIMMIGAILFVIVNLLVDLLYGAADPRVRVRPLERA